MIDYPYFPQGFVSRYNIPVRLRSSIVTGQTITNTGQITRTTLSGSHSAERTGTGGVNDYFAQGIDSVAIQFVDVSLDIQVDNYGPHGAGDGFTYTVQVSNDGEITATNVVVQLYFPGNIAPSAFIPSVGSYDPLTHQWSVGTIPVGTTYNLQISATSNISGIYNVVAQVVGANEIDRDSVPNNGQSIEDDMDDVQVEIQA